MARGSKPRLTGKFKHEYRCPACGVDGAVSRSGLRSAVRSRHAKDCASELTWTKRRL